MAGRALSYFEELRKGSPLHRVTTIDDRTFSIEPVDKGLSDLAAFQRVARDTVRHEGEDGYRITLQNLTGSIYDLLVLKRDVGLFSCLSCEKPESIVSLTGNAWETPGGEIRLN